MEKKDNKSKSPDQLLTDIFTAQTKRLQTKRRLRKEQEKLSAKKCLLNEFSNNASQSVENDESLSNDDES